MDEGWEPHRGGSGKALSKSRRLATALERGVGNVVADPPPPPKALFTAPDMAGTTILSFPRLSRCLSLHPA
jgi:hypothetical protein